MKTIITAIAPSLFSVSVSAADVYQGLDKGNPDLSSPYGNASDFVDAAECRARSRSLDQLDGRRHRRRF